ncbi:MAG: polyprenyl synthetase family protein [Thermoplasmata archaeon]|nr:polyprenyl synthetase family protein [Thermoplasmata archaeon]
MRFAELLTWVPRIDQELSRSYLAEGRRSPAFRPYTALLEEFSMRGGKRLRALLVLAGFHLVDGAAPAPAVPAAAAMEHFQSWMLVHDDIIDHAELRRGAPAVHRLLEREHVRLRRSGDRTDYGVAMGITLGDLEEPYTVRALLGASVPMERREAALSEYVRMTSDTAYGQLLDIRLSGLPVGRVSEAQVLRVHRLKTSVYTVASPLRIGAMLGGASPELLSLLERVGTDLGMAFQLRDDVLGAGLGMVPTEKSANDLKEGKRTLLVVRAWRRSTRSGREELERELERAARDPKAVRSLQERIRSTGSLEHSERAIARLTRRAQTSWQESDALDGNGRRLLGEIAERLVQRSR